MFLPLFCGGARVGTGLLLALALLGACTEVKKPDIPAPLPPVVTPPVAGEEARAYGDYTELTWSDEFDGSGLDLSKWTYELGNNNGWGNRELQSYTNSADNVFVSSGMLTIRARKEATGSPAYTSGRLITKGKKDFQYGRVDVRAKLPKGKGIWPAIWMLGSDIDQNNWPKCGEIDIMELKGSLPNQVLSTMHFASSSGAHQFRNGPVQTLASGTFADDFHIYSVVRSKNLIRVFLDGREFYTFTPESNAPNPFNNNFFAILNVAVGGNFDGDPDATTVFPQQMQVDYVRQYQYK